ncbi:glycine--tRNA ligase [Candidatus Woesearchaeota archaeon]|nr:glycine--tRNA ligase [Candidatus Woesearchaeota archaeon]
MTLTIEEMSTFCKRKGFVYPTAEIYGGLAGFWDFGPLGVELKNNIKRSWWKTFVHNRTDVFGIDGSIITNRKVWEASGHAANFADLMLTSKKTKIKYRADQFLAEKLGIATDGITADEINRLVTEHKLAAENGEEFEEVKPFNLMFETTVGPVKTAQNTAFLRPETAQSIFINFHLVADNARAKLPFGIAQVGKAFRNEISPRDFLFRSREFELMEIEYFIHPERLQECPYFDSVKNLHVQFLSADAQEKNKEHGEISLHALVEQGLTSPWHAYWLGAFFHWFMELGIKKEHLRIREHKREELAHYAGACFDIEYKFPFGWKELQGDADRTQYDLTKHAEYSGKTLQLFDEETKQKVTPYVVAEPAQGVERLFLAILFDAYDDDKARENIVLHFNPSLAPVQVGVFPLVNKLKDKAQEVFAGLQKQFICQYDKSGSIGRRYARADEMGTPLCVTVDFESLEDHSVTVRDRDSMKQIRVPISQLVGVIAQFFAGTPLLSLGKEVIPPQSNAE